MIARLIDLFPAGLQPRLDAAGLLGLRMIAGLAMIYGHGWGKLQGFGENSANFPDPLGVGPATSMALAIFAEFFCALAVTLGLLTRLATVPLIVTMAVAFFVVHADDPFRQKELALVYLAAYAVLLLRGAGAWSIDAVLSRRGTTAA